jgi:putative SOS response-associated peptidase YedK
MPVILDEGNETKWLDSNNNFQSVRELIKPIDDSKIEMSQIDLNYNNNN